MKSNLTYQIKSLFYTKSSALKKIIFNPDKDIHGQIKYAADNTGYVVFISVCNKEERAAVFHSSGKTLEDAWENANEKARKFVNEHKYLAYWIKADIVNAIRTVKSDEVKKIIQPAQANYLREGIAFDNMFNCAFLEGEVNSCKLINYEADVININNVNLYLKRNKSRLNFTEIPTHLFFFTTIGFMCDEDNQTYELHSEKADYGRRKIEVIDDGVVSEVLKNAANFLAKCVQEDGKFIYGNFPPFDRTINNYNILRHTGATWELINQYAMTKENSLVDCIDKLIGYLTENIEFPEPDVAFVIDKKSNEVKLGGIAIAVLAIVSYMEAFQSDKYIKLAHQLGNGIFKLMDINAGTFYHVLNYPDYSKKQEFKIVFYEGEAVYALARLYGFTKEQKYLDAAAAAVKNFIKKDYIKYKDHWVAYAVNEVTKYSPEEEFFTFGLKNAQVNLKRIYEAETSYHIFMELLMASFEMYDRIIENHGDLKYLSEFNDKLFIETIFHRADYMLNGYFYPEFAMYMKNPLFVLNTFFVRHESFRIRIDDVQHFMGGYHMYIKNYDKLLKYKEAFGIDI